MGVVLLASFPPFVTWVDSHASGVLTLNPGTPGCLKSMCCVTSLSSYVAREFGVPQLAQFQPINHCSLQGDPGIQGIKGEKVREPCPGCPLGLRGSLSDPSSSFCRGSRVHHAAQL